MIASYELSDRPAETAAPGLLASFCRRYSFDLDPFQLEAIAELERGRSVLVAAPTGTGKTLVAEYAVFRALAAGHRVFYTTPIKALSNQKYRDFRAQYGAATGLLTGDVVVQPTARARVELATGEVRVAAAGGQVVVMTTEVLRNMLLQEPAALDDVAAVVFDEVHYLADPARGSTWEEAIICCPKHVQLVCLSATVANAGEIADWVSAVHRDTTLVFHAERAVPLEHHYYVDGALRLAVDARGSRAARFPGVGGEARRRLRAASHADLDGPDGSGLPAGAAHREPAPPEVVLALRRAELLPAIYFIFSRREAEAAAAACARVRLVSPETRQRIAAVVEERLAQLAAEDRQLWQVRDLARLLPLGIGFHHAGMLPILKVLVEELFAAGLLGVVFATDTLSLGINMPARTVVLGEFSKFDGESRRLLTSNEYRQLTGRAGRRGIDALGTAVVPYSPWVAAEDAFATATGPILPVESAFAVRYNTVLNLWDLGEADAHGAGPADEREPGERLVHLLSSSLREYQLDGHLRALRARASRLAAAAPPPDLGCPTCTVEGLAEHDLLRRSLPRARKDQAKAEQAEAALLAELEARPWSPPRSEVRRRLREYQGGEPLHVHGQGWGLYLGRPAHADGAVALVLLGQRASLLRTYAEVDHLLADGQRVDLPPALLGLAGEVEDVCPLLADGEAAALESARRQLDLPDVAALAAAQREARRAELAPRLAEAARRVVATRQATRELEAAIAGHPAQTCPRRPEHQEALRRAGRAHEELDELRASIARLGEGRRRETRQTLRSVRRVLEGFGYLRRGQVTAKGRLLRDVFDPNGLIICEGLERGLLADAAPAELAEVLSWFAYDRDQSFPNHHGLPRRLLDLRAALEGVEADVFQSEANADLRLSTGFSRVFFGFALAWCRGATFEQLLARTTLAEGDVMLTFNKTLDLLRQLRDMLRQNAPRHPLLGRLVAAEAQMRRGIVEMCCRTAVGPAEPLALAE